MTTMALEDTAKPYSVAHASATSTFSWGKGALGAIAL
jgi:hypothetical protein